MDWLIESIESQLPMNNLTFFPIGIRPATTLTKEFCEKVCNGKVESPAEMRSLLKATCAYHGQLTKEAAMGT